MPVEDIPGLLWATDEPIVSTATGDLTSAIPFERTGPFYLVLSFNDTGLRTDSDAAIWGLSSQGQWGQEVVLTATVETRYGVTRMEGAGGIVNVPLPTETGGRQTWEFWASAAGLGIATQLDGTATSAGANPGQSHYLTFGHISDWGIDRRRSQTIYRARAYNRIPTAAERAELVAWAASEGGPAGLDATLAAVESGADTATGWVSVAIGAGLAAAGSGREAASGAVSVRNNATLTARETGADTASAAAQIAIAALLAVAETGADAAAGAAAISISATLAATESGSDTASAAIASDWTGITATLAATEAGQDTASASASVGIAAGMSAAETGRETAAATVSAGINATLSAAETGADRASASIGTDFPPVGVTLAATESGADSATATATVGNFAFLAAVESGRDIASGAAAIIIGAQLAAVVSGADTASARLQMPLVGTRFAYPGDRQGGTLAPSARGGILAPSLRSGTIITGG